MPSDALEKQAELCARSPKTAGLWAVLARMRLEAGRFGECIAAAERALALNPKNTVARTAREGALKALEQLDPALAVADLNAALKPNDAAAQLELGRAYLNVDRPAEAARLLNRALELEPEMPPALASLGAAYLSVGMDEAAEHYCRRALAARPGEPVASQTLSTVLEKRGERAEAEAVLDALYERTSLFVERAAAPIATVLVLATRTNGNVPYRHLLPPSRFSRLVWYMEHAQETQVAAMPPYDTVFNAIGDPDLGARTFEITALLNGRLGKPPLNPPARIGPTRRDRLPTLLSDIPGVLAPETVRLDGADIEARGLRASIQSRGLEPPLLIRPVGSHGGLGLERIDNWAALDALQPHYAGAEAYVTRYVDYSSADGWHRKGRIIFVDRRPYPYHWAIGRNWLVHYQTAGMAGDAARQAEERRFLEAPEAFLGLEAMAAIAEIGRRIDLDYCGVDFSILPDGRVLVFEANATMLVHPEEPDGEFAYKNPAFTRIVAAFQSLVQERARSENADCEKLLIRTAASSPTALQQRPERWGAIRQSSASRGWRPRKAQRGQ